MHPLIDVVIKATLILALGHLLIVGLRRLSAGNKHVLASAFLLATALLPLLNVAIPKRTLEVLPASAVLGDQLAEAAADVLQTEIVPRVVDGEPYVEQGDTWGGEEILAGAAAPISGSTPATAVPMETVGELETAPPAGATTSSLFRVESFANLAWMVWLTGVIFVLGRLGLGIGRVLWLRFNARRASREINSLVLGVADRFGARAPDVLISDSADTPFVCGLFRPAIVFPENALGWTRERLVAVATHELAHIMRKDCFTLMLGRLTVALHWFNPLAWALEKESRRLCERACDDVVLRYGEAPSDYAAHILEIARGLPDHDNLTSVALAVSRKSEIEGRLMAILHPTLGRRVVSGRGVIAIATSVLLLAGTAAAFTLGVAPLEASADEAGTATGAEITVTPESAGEDCCEDLEDPNRWGAYSEKQRKKNGKNHYTLGWDFHRLGKYDEAIENFRQAAAWGYRPDTSWYNVACGFARKGEAGKAIRALERAVSLGWDDASHTKRDQDLALIHDHESFSDLVRRMEECDEEMDHAEVSDTADSRYWVSPEISRAAEELRRELEEKGLSMSFSVDEVNEIAYVLLNRGEYELGYEALEEAIRLSDSKSTRALYNMACVKAITDQKAAALDYLSMAIEQGLDRIDLLETDTDLDSIRAEPRFEELVQAARRLSLDSVTEGARTRREKQEAWRASLAEWERKLRAEPRSGRTWANLGFAHYELGEVEQARKAFVRAHQFGYQPGSTAYNIATTFASEGDYTEATHWLEKAEAKGFDVEGSLASDSSMRRYVKQRAKAVEPVAPAASFGWSSSPPASPAPEPSPVLAVSRAEGAAVAPVVWSGSGQSVAPLPPTPPLPPLPPLPVVSAHYASVDHSYVLVHHDSMSVNTFDDSNLSANRNKERTTVRVDGETYRFSTEHLFVFEVDDVMWATTDERTVERAFDIVKHSKHDKRVQSLMKHSRKLEQKSREIQRSYERAAREEERHLRRMQRARNDEQRRELLEEIDDAREEQREAISDLTELMSDREELSRDLDEIAREIDHERRDRSEEMEEIMRDAIRSGVAQRLD